MLSHTNFASLSLSFLFFVSLQVHAELLATQHVVWMIFARECLLCVSVISSVQILRTAAKTSMKSAHLMVSKSRE